MEVSLGKLKSKLTKPFVRTGKSHVAFIDELASTEDRRLSSVKISFTGENPLFYAGTEFISAMRKLFGANPEVLSRQCSNITSVDLSGLSVPFDDNIINVLAIHHSKSLQSLKIMNNLLVNRVSPTCLICMVEQCRKLRHLEVYYSSMSDDALLALAEEDRTPLESITLSCKAETRFTLPLTGEAWQQLVAKSPNISITFLFDHTLALDSMSKFLTWGIPVKNLTIENYAEMNDHLLRVSRLYRRSLESLVITTDNSKYSEDIGTALVQVVTKCTKLKKLMVYTTLTKEVVEEIYKILPNLRNQGCSHLRFPVA
ncbi:hypothetical protein FSP39_000997 [Pinctada imbricata]|uniref:Uncharacterized protein n=1 Tax=Pinctada imbricata TaxID=66713 RepID=A0AA88XH25_PINIB|nr:hypothetical protein FSP39_000997 [Pinctada imbricata]